VKVSARLPITTCVKTQERHCATSWLCPDAAARERLLDMDERLKAPRAAAFAVLGFAVLSTVPLQGLMPLVLLALAVCGFAIVERTRERMARPEFAIVASWVFAQLVIAVAVALTGGPESYAVWWLVIPVVTLPARFGTRGLAAGVVFTAVLLLVCTLVLPAGEAAPLEYKAVFALAALVAVALLSTALMRSDLDHRTEAILDGLTGMLNRRALDQRLDELVAQAEVSGSPIAVIAGDVDHFKRVNDLHGHATGDAVLVDLAYRLRKELRAFDLAYRIGGEEFLVVLPGASLADAAPIAEQLRAAVAAAPAGGVPVTMSFGVACSPAGSFDREAVLADADAALYEAKALGRDRVAYDEPEFLSAAH
jgi:diguanylate cyclase (GGDEF)-like protein